MNTCNSREHAPTVALPRATRWLPVLLVLLLCAGSRAVPSLSSSIATTDHASALQRGDPAHDDARAVASIPAEPTEPVAAPVLPPPAPQAGSIRLSPAQYGSDLQMLAAAYR